MAPELPPRVEVTLGRDGLCLPQSPFPGNGISRPENKAPELPPESNSPLAETKCSRQTPPIGGYLTNLRKSRFARDCVVADPVGIEPVSTV